MSVIEQQMYFAACEDCDWQSVLTYEAALAEKEERTHRAHAHGSTEVESV